ncbi:MAG: MCE family protein [Gemmatimonadetes bacterium]|nr:MCE family protein [Gemmatimonadota bacterium]
MGALVIATTALVLVGYFWLTGRPLTARGYGLVLRVTDAAGLTRGSRVRLAGVEVGAVRNVRLHGSAALVELAVERDVFLPSDSRALVTSEGVFGNRQVELLLGRAFTRVQDGDTITAVAQSAIEEALAVASHRAGQVLTQAAEVLSPETAAAMHGGLLSLARALEDLAALTGNLRQTAEGLRRGFDAGRLDRSGAAFEATADQLAASSRELRAAGASLASLLAKVDRGQGSLGRLVNDARLYQAVLAATARIDTVAQQATLLLEDIQARPGRYVKVSVF